MRSVKCSCYFSRSQLSQEVLGRSSACPELKAVRVLSSLKYSKFCERAGAPRGPPKPQSCSSTSLGMSPQIPVDGDNASLSQDQLLLSVSSRTGLGSPDGGRKTLQILGVTCACRMEEEGENSRGSWVDLHSGLFPQIRWQIVSGTASQCPAGSGGF